MNVEDRLARLEALVGKPGGDVINSKVGQQVAKDGTVTYDFAGHVKATGLDLPAGIAFATQPDEDKIRWIRQSDGSVVAEQYSYRDAGNGGSLELSQRLLEEKGTAGVNVQARGPDGDTPQVSLLRSHAPAGGFPHSRIELDVTAPTAARSRGQVRVRAGDSSTEFEAGVTDKLLLDETGQSDYLCRRFGGSTGRYSTGTSSLEVGTGFNFSLPKNLPHGLGRVPVAAWGGVNAGAENYTIVFEFRPVGWGVTEIRWQAICSSNVPGTINMGFWWFAVA